MGDDKWPMNNETLSLQSQEKAKDMADVDKRNFLPLQL
jgi:hypothetical protein